MTDLTHSSIRSDMERRSEYEHRVLLNEILVELKSIRVLLEDARRVVAAIGDTDEHRMTMTDDDFLGRNDNV